MRDLADQLRAGCGPVVLLIVISVGMIIVGGIYA